jgi:pimeloyl-ACP methyl ester carboxylesterase
MAYDYTRAALYRPGTLPVFPDDIGPAPTPVGDGSSIRVLDAWWMSKMAHVAYHDVDAWGGLLDKVGLSLVASFDNTGTQAFLAKGSDWAVLSFRGTQPDETRDVLQDLKVVPTTIQDGVKAHLGFVEALDFVWADVDAALDEVEGLDLWYTGHSLGAALSMLAATRRPATGVVNFGCPRVGQEGFASLLAGTPHVLRIVNGCDVVTRVPPPELGYEHVGEELFLSPDGTRVPNPDPAVVAKVRWRAAWRYQLRFPLFRGWVLDKGMVDHAIVNYSAGLEEPPEASAAREP